MSFAAYRRSRELTLLQCCEALNLSPNSQGHLSRIENGAAAAIPLALKIEAWSGGDVPAESLLSDDDAKLLAGHRRLATAHPVEVAA